MQHVPPDDSILGELKELQHDMFSQISDFRVGGSGQGQYRTPDDPSPDPRVPAVSQAPLVMAANLPSPWNTPALVQQPPLIALAPEFTHHHRLAGKCLAPDSIAIIVFIFLSLYMLKSIHIMTDLLANARALALLSFFCVVPTLAVKCRALINSPGIKFFLHRIHSSVRSHDLARCIQRECFCLQTLLSLSALCIDEICKCLQAQ